MEEDRFTVLEDRVAAEERLVVPVFAEERVAWVALRPATEEERAAPVPEVVERVTLLAEVRAAEVLAALPFALERVVALEGRLAAARVVVEAELRVATLPAEDRFEAELDRLARPPRASVRRPWVRLLVLK